MTKKKFKLEVIFELEGDVSLESFNHQMGYLIQDFEFWDDYHEDKEEQEISVRISDWIGVTDVTNE